MNLAENVVYEISPFNITLKQFVYPYLLSSIKVVFCVESSRRGMKDEESEVAVASMVLN